MLVDGVMLLWFGLVVLSVAFVAIDIRTTPENPVMKWGFVLITLYSGPFGAFFYVLGCREPLPGLHERYVAARWRQVLGSTMHCVAGDGVGILAGAVIGSVVPLSVPIEVALEYVLGFGFGWVIFQSLFMREMFGSFAASLKGTFRSELLSMNCMMGGMIPMSALAWAGSAAAHDPTEPLFWFRMSIALMTGFVVAYPMNWWLVANHLKHGMMTVRHPNDPYAHKEQTAMTMPKRPPVTTPSIAVMTVVSILVLATGVAIAWVFGGLTQ
ncbi:DUF4396 domain-containing protein [Bauldia sp.]|uniref:DUF4396 domain-containing protein n=1 Tax=Bauldia sp. TaxID=2575872 RepID=UPI003BADA7FC